MITDRVPSLAKLMRFCRLFAASVVHPLFVGAFVFGGICVIGQAPILFMVVISTIGFMLAWWSSVIRARMASAAGDEAVEAETTRFAAPARSADSGVHYVSAKTVDRRTLEPTQVPVVSRKTPDWLISEGGDDLIAKVRAAGITNISFTVHNGIVSGAENTSEGLVIDLVADVITIIQRNGAGTALGAYSEAHDLISFTVPRELLDADYDGLLFGSTMEAWNARTETVDIEWHMTLDGDVIHAIAHFNGYTVTVGKPAPIR